MENQTFKIAVNKIALQEKLKSGDPRWKQFNSAFVNLDATDMQVLRCVYDGRAITTQHNNNWRSTENYLCGQHIGLDFDTEDKQSTIGQLKNDKFISRYGSFIHTTPSHTIEKPRARVVFFLDKPIMQAKNYSAAAAAMVWLFGQADQKCKDAVRFFYGSYHCNYHYIGAVLPLDQIKQIITQHKEAQKPRKQSDYPKETPATQAEVQDALSYINPWAIDYNDWVNVLMGIHSEFGEDGYYLAERWASGKPGEVEQKWKSFRKDGNVSGIVTIATVFSYAKQFGWKKSLQSIEIMV